MSNDHRHPAPGGLPARQGRPSLSDPPSVGQHSFAEGVAGPPGPAFVERARPLCRRVERPRVAGPPGPAFVERTSCRRTSLSPNGVGLPARQGRPSLSAAHRQRRRRRDVGLPARQGRPSLSVEGAGVGLDADDLRVAGPPGPAFVERGPPPPDTTRPGRGLPARQGRPSLSDQVRRPRRRGLPRVAGPPGPAFVERSTTSAPSAGRSGGGLPARQGRPSLSGTYPWVGR